MAPKCADLSREYDFSHKQADGIVPVVNDSILLLDKRFNDVDRLINEVDDRITDVESNINNRFNQLEKKFWFTIAGSAVVTSVAVMSDLTTIVGFFSG